MKGGIGSEEWGRGQTAQLRRYNLNRDWRELAREYIEVTASQAERIAEASVLRRGRTTRGFSISRPVQPKQMGQGRTAGDEGREEQGSRPGSLLEDLGSSFEENAEPWEGVSGGCYDPPVI